MQSTQLPSNQEFSPIPQCDGASSFLESTLDLGFMKDVNIGDCDECGFCNIYESILTVDEYLEHLKTYGSVCFNCMDYFYVTPWFRFVHPDYIDDEE